MSCSRKARLRSALVALALPLTLVVAPQAATASSEPLTLEGPNVIQYGTEDYTFASSTDYIRQGTRAGEHGCEFVLEGVIQPEAPDITEIEVAYDPDTCRALVRSGVASSGSPGTPSSTDVQDSTATAASADGTASTGDFGVAAVGRQQRYAWSWYDEPARWAFNCDVEDGVAQGCLLPPVNWVKNTIEWAADPSCTIAAGTLAWFSSQTSRLTATGWTMPRNIWSINPGPIACTEQLYNVNDNHFQNRVFCQAIVDFLSPFPIPVLPTNTYYSPNELRVNNDDTTSYRQVLRKDGGCQSFLRAGNRRGPGLG
jgi:hypothetical protein